MQKSGKKNLVCSVKEKKLSPYFPLTLKQLQHQAELNVFFADHIISTHSMKNVVNFFEQQLPGVLETKCFNEHNLPFRVEIIKTELAHLFEHIILVLLCQAKSVRGVSNPTFKGETSWDWNVTPKGFFTIVLSVKESDAELLEEVLPQATFLLDAFLAKDGIQPEQNQSRQALLPTWYLSGDSLSLSRAT